MKNKFLLIFLISFFLIGTTFSSFTQDAKLKDMVIKLINSGEVKSVTIYNTGGQMFIAFDGSTPVNEIEKFKFIENDILFLEEGKNNTCYISLSTIKAYSFNLKKKTLYIFL